MISDNLKRGILSANMLSLHNTIDKIIFKNMNN